MPIAWPDTLPQHFLRQGNQESIPDDRQFTDVDRGPPKVRPGSSALGRPYSAAWRMNAAQIEILIAFERDDLGNAALPFTIPSPRDGVTWLVMFAKGGRASWVEIGNGRYNVTAQLLVLP